MTWINKVLNSFYNFRAPSIDADADTKVEVVFPTAEVLNPTVTATTAVAINRAKTVVNLGELADNVTLNATVSSDIAVGDTVMVKASSGGTAKTVTFGTGFSGPTMAGTQNKSKATTFMFDGTSFVQVAVAVTLD